MKPSTTLPFLARSARRAPSEARLFASRVLGTLVALALAAPPMLGLAGCERALASEDLMEGVEPSTSQPTSDVDLDGPGADALAAFSVRLFQRCDPGSGSMLASPLSALCALGMTANGADGDTRAQMEELFGLSVLDLDAYLKSYAGSVSSDENAPLRLANSLWIKDVEDLDVRQAFLQANADCFDAGAFRSPFDATTAADINEWTSEHTDGMIPRIVEDVSDDSLMCLVNALSFEAAWLDEYEDGDVHDATFTCEDGTQRRASLMHSTERGYLEDEGAVGFVKYYEGGRYAFAALLPDEGTSVADYAATLTGERLRSVLGSARFDVEVDAAVPKFESDWGADLSKALSELGMSDAFDPDVADFSGIAGEPGYLYVGSVVHKTHVEMDEHGTKAAAATAVEMVGAAAAGPEEEPEVKVVHLDRPFVYGIVDCATNVPVLIGSAMDV